LSIFEAIVAILLVKKEEMWKKHPFYRATVFFLLMVGAVLLFVIAVVSLGTITFVFSPKGGKIRIYIYFR
jgi:hypothetical protein